MPESSRYLRGQIWHWNDPVYGKKEEALMTVDPLEETFRYSRYVLIVQSDDLPFCNSILVIPCSSRKCFKSDIRIPIHGYNSKTESYIRPERLFPVNPRSLSTYICTLSEKTMTEVEAVLARIMFPNVFKMKQFKDYVGSKDVKLDRFKEIKSIHSEQFNETSKKEKWNDEEIDRFMQHYQQYGPNETAETYELSLSTVKRYYTNFRRQIQIKQQNDFTAKVCKADDINEAMSVYSNNVSKELKDSGFCLAYYKDCENQDLFYRTVGSMVYHALGTLFNFRFFEKKYTYNNIPANFFQIESLRFVYSKYLDWMNPDDEYYMDTSFYEILDNKIANRIDLPGDVRQELIHQIKMINGES